MDPKTYLTITDTSLEALDLPELARLVPKEAPSV
jgi:hypothetical protein